MDPTNKTSRHRPAPSEDPDFAPTAEFKRFLDGDQPQATSSGAQPGRSAGSGGWIARLRAGWRRRRTGR